MKTYEYIIQQVKKAHFSAWNDEELRRCMDMLHELSREELLAIYQSRWLQGDKHLKEAVFQLLFKERIGIRDEKIKAMNVDELIANLHDENGYGKYIVLEMKARYDSLTEDDKVKILDALAATTKVNQRWAEGERKRITETL